jgi:hypothetical protein
MTTMTKTRRISVSFLITLAFLAVFSYASSASAASTGSRHCAMATSKTPQVCATATAGHNLEVVVNGKWVAAHPAAVPTGYTYMGGARVDFNFTATAGTANSWTSKVTLPAGRLWYIKVTVVSGTTSKVISLQSNIV